MKSSPKVIVPVNVIFDRDGSMRPYKFRWEDGKIYLIDKVTDIRPAHAEKAGGQGDRYTIIVDGKQHYLFFEHNSDSESLKAGTWFMEREG